MADDVAESDKVVFGLPRLIRRILSFLPVSDLHNCCLVNRHWNSHGRFVLGNNKRCLINVSSVAPCSSFAYLKVLLNPRESEDDEIQGPTTTTLCSFPWNGLRIVGDVQQAHHCGQRTRKDHGLQYRTLTQYFPIKLLELSCSNFHKCWLLEELIISILSSRDNVLEELSIITRWPLSRCSQDWEPPWPLHRLRVLRIQLDWSEGVGFTMKILRSAPNLKAFYPSFHYARLGRQPPWHSGFSFGRPEVLKAFYFIPNWAEEWEQFCAEGSPPKLRRLYLPGFEVHTKPSTLSQMENILGLSYSHLTTLHIHQVVFNRILDRAQCPPLVQLTTLGVHRSMCWELREIQKLTTRLQDHASRLFPQMKSLELRHGFFLMSPAPYLQREFEDDRVLQWTGERKGRKVMTLTCLAITSDDGIPPAICGRPDVLQFLSLEFCAVTELTLVYDKNFADKIQLSGVWEHCSQLIKLSILHSHGADEEICFQRWRGGRLDSEFCGITQEEAKMLRNSEFIISFEDEKKLQIVPLRPSIMWLTGLRVLCLDTFLSNPRSLTFCLTLSRMPKLQVSYGCGAPNYCINDINDQPDVQVPCQQDFR